MKKALLALAMSGALALSACGHAAPPSSSAPADDKTITVGASAVPHAEILRSIEKDLAKEGYKLEIVEFTDFVKPNKALVDGELDANFFQHQPYLDYFNAENKTDLVPVAYVNFIPMQLVLGKAKDLAHLPDGATIAIPNDASNEARALLLLADNGLITMKDGAGIEATVRDITANPHHFKLQEMEAAQIPRIISDVDLALVNGNYFISAGLDPKSAPTGENPDSEAAKAYANLIAVRPADRDNAKIRALATALTGPTARNFTKDKYHGGVLPVDNATVEAYFAQKAK